jgi:hypothetical protein
MKDQQLLHLLEKLQGNVAYYLKGAVEGMWRQKKVRVFMVQATSILGHQPLPQDPLWTLAFLEECAYFAGCCLENVL